jgi:hypothetical protein
MIIEYLFNVAIVAGMAAAILAPLCAWCAFAIPWVEKRMGFKGVVISSLTVTILLLAIPVTWGS